MGGRWPGDRILQLFFNCQIILLDSVHHIHEPEFVQGRSITCLFIIRGQLSVPCLRSPTASLRCVGRNIRFPFTLWNHGSLLAQLMGSHVHQLCYHSALSSYKGNTEMFQRRRAPRSSTTCCFPSTSRRPRHWHDIGNLPNIPPGGFLGDVNHAARTSSGQHRNLFIFGT